MKEFIKDINIIDGPTYLAGRKNVAIFFVDKKKINRIPEIGDIIIDGNVRYEIFEVNETIKLLAIDPPLPGSYLICICNKND